MQLASLLIQIELEQRESIRQALPLTEEEQQVFWPLYDEYSIEKNKLREDKILLIQTYLQEYSNLSDKESNTLTWEGLLLREKGVDLDKKYFKKMSKVLPAKTVGRFFQIESQLQTLNNWRIINNFPLIRNQK
ncbi:hypothetical protein GCM10023331_00640 [Algivirga pacifica]|uniref:Uncharacterized protein n=2 Tax=Algivirga pacifica TaxID=1162670 RepID=A0ABP9D1R9_9BACT